MFKKLRNKLLVVNTLIIASLVLGSFSVIYFMTARNVHWGIEQKLERNINVFRQFNQKENVKGRNMSKPNGDKPPEIHNNEPFSLTFTIVTDIDGNIEKANIPFTLNEDFYTDKIHNIISDKDDSGKIRTDNSYWAYKKCLVDMKYIIAFTDIQAENTILRNLFLILLFVGLLALAVAFLISLFSANRSIRPVEESYNKQKQFVADASHELKTPLTTINTNVDVLLSHPKSTIGEESKWLNYIKTESERMTKLTNDLLYLAKLDHNDGEIMLSRVSFSEAVESVILLMEAVIFENNINLEYDISPDLYVKGSLEQLKQLVMILLDNAIKYTPKNGNIDISLKRDNSDAVFTIRNTGEGISDDAQKQIFERFYREDKSRARESGGYGLGLAIAHAIVKQCKGSIGVESKKNEYTKFTVEIPLSK